MTSFPLLPLLLMSRSFTTPTSPFRKLLIFIMTLVLLPQPTTLLILTACFLMPPPSLRPWKRSMGLNCFQGLYRLREERLVSLGLYRLREGRLLCWFGTKYPYFGQRNHHKGKRSGTDRSDHGKKRERSELQRGRKRSKREETCNPSQGPSVIRFPFGEENWNFNWK